MVHELKKIKSTLSNKRESLSRLSDEKRVIEEKLTKSEFEKLAELRKQKQTNEEILKVMIIGHKLNELVDKWTLEEQEKDVEFENRAKGYG